MSEEVVIQLKDVHKSYYLGNGEEVQVLKGVDVEIKKGEFVALMGESGGGKTTLLNILGCLHPLSSGTYLLEGENIGDVRDDGTLAFIRNKKMGFVFQSFNLLPRDTVEENVARPLLYAKVNRRERNTIVGHALESVGMSHRIYHRPFELSGGEKQRVAIARAIVNNPRVIFADEPTGNLDSQSGANVMDVFQALHTEGRTIILISHDREISKHAPRLLSIRDGLLVSDERGNAASVQ